MNLASSKSSRGLVGFVRALPGACIAKFLALRLGTWVYVMEVTSPKLAASVVLVDYFARCDRIFSAVSDWMRLSCFTYTYSSILAAGFCARDLEDVPFPLHSGA